MSRSAAAWRFFSRTKRGRAAVAGGLLVILAVGVILAVLPAGPKRQEEPAVTARPGPLLTDQVLPGRQVWGHLIPQGLPNFSQGSDGLNQYGELYPLDLVEGTAATPPRAETGVQRAAAAGLTGMQILQYEANAGTDFVSDWIGQADPTWADKNPDNNFSVAPCLGIGSRVDDAVRLITEYSAFADGHPSASRVDGRLVIFVYGSQDMSPAGWSQVRSRLRTAGVNPFLVGDLGADAQARPYSQRSAPIVARFPAFDASYTFDSTAPASWPDLVAFLNANHRQYAGGMMPGYDRETCADCPYNDAQGTRAYREQWQQNLSSGAHWQTVSTWNDMVERTEIEPTSAWNTTRSDITAFYAAKFRGIAFPRPTAQLYVTSPSYVRLGQAVRAEGLILNGGTSPVKVTTQLVDGNGQAVGTPVSTTVPAGQAADASTPATETIAVMPARRFLRARSTSFDGAGNVLQRVTSAPVVVYTAGDDPTPQLRRLYYSIPAYAALPADPTLTISGDPATGPATAITTAPGGATVRFNEVLQNTRQVFNGFALEKISASLPMISRSIIGSQTITASPHGYYVARVISENEQVGYSDPVYVP